MNVNKTLLRALFVVCCFITTFETQAQIEDLLVGNTNRKMLVYAPSGIEPNSALLISMHGMNQDIDYQKNQAKWELLAKEHGFVVVYPAGISNSWDISGNRDIDFILAIIHEMYNRYAIDSNRVYLSGFSMGGMMTYHAANKIADKIAAFAPVSGYLMGGPNTNSSRPIPIIHTHGTTDDVVAFSGVKTCLDAWVTRNNCPATAVVTKPYPVDKPNSSGTKHYWGPGTDSVEIVLMELAGKGHWHSNEESGVHTSREIWNFCKKFTLAYGIPKVNLAFVNNNNPKQIVVNFSLPISATENFEGFSVKVNNIDAEIDTVVLTDSVHLAISLVNGIDKSDEITLSYNDGNVLSTYQKKLANFNNAIVENLLIGSSPRFVNISVGGLGDTLVAIFNKKMLLPTDVSGLKLKAQHTENIDIQVLSGSFYNNDSTMLCFKLGQKVYADYNLTLNYESQNIVSADSGFLKTFINLPVKNTAKGLPVKITSAMLEDNAFTLALEFSKAMRITANQVSQLNILVNDVSVDIEEVFAVTNTLRVVLKNNLYYGDIIKASYTPGDITAADKGELEAFENQVVENKLAMPTWLSIPGKIEAENYAMQYGTDTETTSDTGGGLNVGWTDSGDWLVYAVENLSDSTTFNISFRYAAESSGARFDFYVDDQKAGIFNVPSTGGWQKFKTAVDTITIPAGKHYIKFLTVNGGFNINFFEINQLSTAINGQVKHDIIFYPNPVSDKLFINIDNFNHSKVIIYDTKGLQVKTITTNAEPLVTIPVNLPNGLYMVKVVGNNGFVTKMVQVSK